MPPRHGKSLLVSEHFPAWYLGQFPDRRVILTSYEADFAATWGRKARRILEGHGPSLFGVTVDRSSSAGDRWDILGRRGGMGTAGVRGAITGKGADLLIVDDPVKNSEQANSFVIREAIWDWWQSTAYTRLEPGASVVLVQTRWHGDDLAGRILREMRDGGEQWDVVNLPALSRADDLLGRRPGEALWPERYSATELARIRAAVGEYNFLALYDQDPQEDEGGVVKRSWLRYCEVRGGHYRLLNPDGTVWRVIEAARMSRVQIIDCAATSDDVKKERSGRKASFSVIATFDVELRTGVTVWVDVRRGKWEFPQLKEEAKQAYADLGASWVGIEDEKTGRALIQELRLSGVSVRAISPGGKDKKTRAARWLNEMSQGHWFIPGSAPWKGDLVKELLAWSGHPDEPADQVDVAAYCALHSGVASCLTIPGGVKDGGIIMGRLLGGVR